jgi:transcriptional regulator with PAS, ATPase and Fis domain
MKKKPLAYYLNLMKSAQDKQDWTKVKRHGEIALKKLSHLSYSPFEEYLLYVRLGYAYLYLGEHSHSIENYYKAYLLASRHHLEPAYIAITSVGLGNNFLEIKNINQALLQLQKVDQYYQKYGDGIFPMDKQKYLNNLMDLGLCYLYKNELGKVREIIEQKLSSFQPFPSEGLVPINYHHLKGKYLMVVKEYDQARQSFQECIKFSVQFSFPNAVLSIKIYLAVIELLEGQPDAAIQILQETLKDARRLKLNNFFCEAGLLLSKCYTLKNMPDKAAAIEKRIKSLLNKLDIVWLYEKTREFEQLYRQLQPIYPSETKFVPSILTHTINQRQEKLPYQIIGHSVPIKEIYQLIDKIAPTDLPVLIQGETGVGKELAARAIHNNSLRKEKTWLAVNCGALSETLLENELFGHTKGAFTDAKEEKKGYIEIASEGTLFLDEIVDMFPAMQQKLLRVLEEKLMWKVGAEKPIPINTRFIFASNQSIEELVKAKKFREDLYYRINTIVIILPPLRDRKDDIPLLVQHFLAKYSVSSKSEIRNQKSEIEIALDVLALLMNYYWPGNVRELENEIKRICTLYPNVKNITEGMLSESIRNYTGTGYKQSGEISSVKDLKNVYEIKLIKESLKRCAGNVTRTARELGWSRRHLYRKINQFKIPSGDYVTKT